MLLAQTVQDKLHPKVYISGQIKLKSIYLSINSKMQCKLH